MTKRITINNKNLKPNNTWQIFKKVRAIIENEKNEFVITQEANKVIFPGGSCEENEIPEKAIIRELAEELGINFNKYKLNKILEIETYSDNYYDYRLKSNICRYTLTTYFYVKINEPINYKSQNLTEDEKNQHFETFFTNKDNLIKLLNENHKDAFNGQFFDQENQIIINNFLLNKR